MRDRVDTIKKKAKVIKNILRVIGILVFASVIYTGLSGYSIINTGLDVSDDTDFLWNDGGSPLDANDDTIDFIVNVTISNNGLFPINYIDVLIDVYLDSTNDPSYPGLINPADGYLGPGIKNITAIEPNTNKNETLTFTLQPDLYELNALVWYDGVLRMYFHIWTEVQVFPIYIEGDFTIEWSALI